MKARSLSVQRLGTAVIQHSALGSPDRRYMRAIAERVRNFEDDMETETMTIVSLKVPGRRDEVAFCFHHGFHRSRTWLVTESWSKIALRAMNGGGKGAAAVAHYIQACEDMYRDA